MIPQDNGGPAFPCSGTNNAYAPQGMSLRDWFAGQSLIGILPNSQARAAQDIPLLIEFVARQSYAVADAMLKEREKHE